MWPMMSMRPAIRVYIVRCADGSYYTGSYRGADVATRVGEHNTRKYPDEE